MHTHLRAQVDSLSKALSNASADTNKVNILNKLAIDIMGTDINKAKEYSLESEKLAKKLDFKKGEASALQIIGAVAGVKSDFNTAIEYQYKSLEINEKIPSRKGVTVCLNNIGTYYYKQGNYAKALENHFKALTEREKTNDKKGVLSSLNNIGLVYDQQKNTIKALEYYNKGLSLAKELKNKPIEATILFNLANIYANQKQKEKSLKYNLEATKIREEIVDINLSSSYRALGENYIVVSDFENAEKYLQKALKLAQDNEDLETTAVTYCTLGEMEDKQKNYNKAIEFHLKGYKMAKEIGAKIIVKDALADLKKIYAVMGNYSKAYEVGEEFLMFKDSLFNEDKSKEIGKLEGGFELEKKLEAEKRIKDAKDAKEKEDKKRIVNLQYSGIFLVLILAFVGLIFTKKFNISPKMMENVTFFLFLIFFEFILVFTEPILSDYTGGLPLLTLAANVVLALIFTPMHRYMEGKFKKAAITREKK